MKVLGVSGSPRKNGVTAQLVRKTLEATQAAETEFVSLGGKDIRPCMACLACARGNVCVIKDDMAPLRQKLLDADAVILGGCNIYNTLNGLTHAFLERFYQFYHKGVYLLREKAFAVIGAGGGSGQVVVDEIARFLFYHKVTPVASFQARGPVPCFSCGFGHECSVSSAAWAKKPDGELDNSKKPSVEKQPEILARCKEIGAAIREAVPETEESREE